MPLIGRGITDGSTTRSTAAALRMRTAPPLAGLVQTREAIHSPAGKKVPNKRLLGRRAICLASATVVDLLIVQAAAILEAIVQAAAALEVTVQVEAISVEVTEVESPIVPAEEMSEVPVSLIEAASAGAIESVTGIQAAVLQ